MRIVEYVISNGKMSKRKPFLRTVHTQKEIEQHRTNRLRVHRISPGENTIEFVLSFTKSEIIGNKHTNFRA